MKLKNIILFVVFTAIFSGRYYGQCGILDNTFGNGGKTAIAIGNEYDDCRSMALQNDGKIIMAGSYYDGADWDFAIIRCNSDGSLDNSFDIDGKASVDFGGTDECNSVAIQADGKIVLAGRTNDDFALCRYNGNGSLDQTFGASGKVVTTLGNFGSVAMGVVIQGDGKIVVTGWYFNGTNYDIAVIRYDVNGQLDSTFDNDGIVITDRVNVNDNAFAVTTQTDGKIVVAGGTSVNNHGVIILLRYNSDGSLDNYFGTGGIMASENSTTTIVGNALSIQSDGKIIVAGSRINGNQYDFALARYNSNGSLDNSFGSGGMVSTDFGALDDHAMSVTTLPNGKILVGGLCTIATYPDFALALYNSNGSLDNSFDFDGRISLNFGTASDWGRSVAVQSDGKIVIAGTASNGGYGDFGIARYDCSNVGVSEVTIVDELNIYPNPTSGIISLHINCQASQICVSDVIGNRIMNLDCDTYKSQELDLRGKTKGIYFIEIVSESRRIVKKIVLN